MIVVRDDFPAPRLLVDDSGTCYTFTLETTHDSLADYEQKLGLLQADDAYPSRCGRVTPVMEGGHREFLAVIG